MRETNSSGYRPWRSYNSDDLRAARRNCLHDAPTMTKWCKLGDLKMILSADQQIHVELVAIFTKILQDLDDQEVPFFERGVVTQAIPQVVAALIAALVAKFNIEIKA